MMRKINCGLNVAVDVGDLVVRRLCRAALVAASSSIARKYGHDSADWPLLVAKTIILRMKERIQKVLSAAGVASRRHVEQMVLDGRISVNGKIVTTLPVLVDVTKDKIEVDLEPVKFQRPTASKNRSPGRDPTRFYFLLYKPTGVYTTNVAQGTQLRAIDLLPEEFGRLYPVGRLEADSKGILILTNDGELTNLLTHPRYGVSKTYRATIEGQISPEDTRELEKGVWLGRLGGGDPIKTPPAQVTIVRQSHERSIVDITLKEGKHSEIRRLFARTGHKVRELTRTKLGPLNLDGLRPGKFRELTPSEVRALYRLAQAKNEKAKKSK